MGVKFQGESIIKVSLKREELQRVNQLKLKVCNGKLQSNNQT